MTLYLPSLIHVYSLCKRLITVVNLVNIDLDFISPKAAHVYFVQAYMMQSYIKRFNGHR